MSFEKLKLDREIKSKLDAIEFHQGVVDNLGRDRNKLIVEIGELETELNKKKMSASEEIDKLTGRERELSIVVRIKETEVENLDKLFLEIKKKEENFVKNVEKKVSALNKELQDKEKLLKKTEDNLCLTSDEYRNTLLEINNVKDKLDKHSNNLSELSLEEDKKKNILLEKNNLVKWLQNKLDNLIKDIGDISLREEKIVKRENACLKMELELQTKHQEFLKQYDSNSHKTTTS